MEQPQHPAPPRRARIPRAEYRWTSAKAMAFLHALATHGKLATAARAMGMTRQSVYRLAARAPVFAEGLALARAGGRARCGRVPVAPQRDASGAAR